MQRIALIGLGPHAKRIYYPYLTELIKNDPDFVLELIIDLEMNRSKIESFLKQENLQPKKIIYLSSKGQISPKSIHPDAHKALKDHNITKAIISTEPKAHKVYLLACIKLGIPVVVDKPVTAPTGLTSSMMFKPAFIKMQVAKRIYKDVNELQQAIEKTPGARVLVQCQRRNHGGYKIVLDKATQIVNEYHIPITYINIHHSDGMWNMPDEFIYRENHPYKYGYGKLMHSGYHFIDLLTSLITINTTLPGKTPDKLNITSQAIRPPDQHTTISGDEYAAFFGKSKTKALKAAMIHKTLKSHGEIDSYSQMQFTKKGKVITTAQLSLMQSGFSQRAWAELPEDAYKSNGRVRHEFINIHIGPLCSIQVHSYQSTEVSDVSGPSSSVGHKNHFDIYIFRNSNLIGGKAFEHIPFGDIETIQQRDNGQYLGHNEEARYQTLDELMYDKPSNSELLQHISTNRMLAAIYKNHIKQHSGIIPFSKFKFKDIFS